MSLFFSMLFVAKTLEQKLPIMSMESLVYFLKRESFGWATVYYGTYHEKRRCNDVCHEWPRDKILKVRIEDGIIREFNRHITWDDIPNIDHCILKMKNGIISHLIIPFGQSSLRKQVFQVTRGSWRKWTKSEVEENICLMGAIAF